MAKNKWIKWVVGISSVSSVVAIFSVLTTNEEATEAPTLTASLNQDAVDNQQPVLELEKLKQNELKKREEWISSLDWEEGNWDVNQTDKGIVFTPAQKSEGLPPSENRTRRS
ncbi:hypothetical protein LC040_18505 [Bacillus tianshenii]|nr:hypothetical protein LC040_18505 [Bacillus tianshenii]